MPSYNTEHNARHPRYIHAAHLCNAADEQNEELQKKLIYTHDKYCLSWNIRVQPFPPAERPQYIGTCTTTSIAKSKLQRETKEQKKISGTALKKQLSTNYSDVRSDWQNRVNISLSVQYTVQIISTFETSYFTGAATRTQMCCLHWDLCGFYPQILFFLMQISTFD